MVVKISFSSIRVWITEIMRADLCESGYEFFYSFDDFFLTEHHDISNELVKIWGTLMASTLASIF